ETTSARLALLHNIALTLSQSLDLDKMLNAALKELVAPLNIEVAAIFLMEEETLILKAQHHLPPAIFNELSTRSLAQTQLDAICRQGDITMGPFCPSMLKSTDMIQEEKAESYFNGQAFLFVPLKAKGIINGLLVAGPLDSLGSLEVDQELMEGIANQLAVAVE